MSITIEHRLNNTIDRLCAIKAQLQQGKIEVALLSIKALETSLQQSLASLS